MKKGDRYRDDADTWPLFIEVTRAARDGSWVDLRMCNWACLWRVRVKTPLPPSTYLQAWTHADVVASEPSDEEWDAFVAERSRT